MQGIGNSIHKCLRNSFYVFVYSFHSFDIETGVARTLLIILQSEKIKHGRKKQHNMWYNSLQQSAVYCVCVHCAVDVDISPPLVQSLRGLSVSWSLQNTRHDLFGDWNSAGCLEMGTSWYFSWKMNYFGILKWKQGLFNIPQSGHESVYLLEPSFHSRTPNNSTFMKNISWCPCLKVRVNFLPRRNYAAHFTVPRLVLLGLFWDLGFLPRLISNRKML